VHRDLKPSNIMLGRFGEVYVLDWGIAKLVGTVEEISSGGGSSEEGVTKAGAFIGTPGYAAPEQVAGVAVDARSDVYALGVILFELLSLEPLHAGGALTRMMSTADGVETSISSRAREHDLPPELEAVCVRATRKSPDDRFANVRELNDMVEAFLEGESNVQLRRELAEDHARASEQLAVRALIGRGSIDERRQAMEEAGRALALEPTNELASKTMMSLMTTEPKEAPPEVSEELEAANSREIVRSARVATLAYTSFMLFLPLIMWQGVRSWPPIVIIFVGFAICAAIAISAMQKPTFTRSFVALTLSNAVASLASLFYGSLFLVPAIVAPNTLAYVMHLRREHRWFAVANGLLAVAAPFALEISGVVSAPYAFEDGAMTILPRAISLPELPTLTALLLFSVAGIVFSVLATAEVRNELLHARRQLYVQGWHLRSLFPGTSPRPSQPPLPSGRARNKTGTTVTT